MDEATRREPSDVGMERFDPWPESSVHLEWGVIGARQAAQRGDLVVVVDVLSFSTTLAVAVERGITSIVYSGEEIASMGGLTAAGERLGARPISSQRRAAPGELSLSPASLLTADRDQRVLFTSFNGALVVSAGQDAPGVYVIALRNATAGARLVAAAVREGLAARVTLIACGEQWTSVAAQDAGFRPSVEDWVGAGYIAAALAKEGLVLSTEARVAIPSPAHLEAIRSSVSARELLAAGFQKDVDLALEVDVCDVVPVRSDRDPAGRTFVGVEAGTEPRTARAGPSRPSRP